MKLWRVDDVMTSDVVTVRADTPYREIVDLLVECGISAVPVVDTTDRAVGLISESDLLLKVSKGPADKVFVSRGYRRDRKKSHGRVAADVMTSPVVTALPSLDVVDRLAYEIDDLMSAGSAVGVPVGLA